MSVATSPASLLHGSHLSAGACTRARLPCTSSASFRVVLACQHLCPSHTAYFAPCLPRSLLLSQCRLCPSRLGQRPRPPLFSLVSLACRCLRPSQPATILSTQRRQLTCSLTTCAAASRLRLRGCISSLLRPIDEQLASIACLGYTLNADAQHVEVKYTESAV